MDLALLYHTLMTMPIYTPEVQYFGGGPDGAPLLVRDGLSDDEERIRKQLKSQIELHAEPNKKKQNYYEAKQIIRHLDIAVPRVLTDIGTAVGWAGTVVDVLDERVDFLGWDTASGDINGLDEVYHLNDLGVESNYSHIDALTTGVSFISVGVGDAGEPLVCIESSSTASLIWDYRQRRSIAGLSQTLDSNGNPRMETLYLENVNITLMRKELTDAWTVVDRDEHNLGRCFMTRLVNRCRPYQLDGRSEITRAVRYLTDAAVRTMLGMEVNREFYTAPQRFVLNADPADFGVKSEMTAEEKFRRGLSVAMGMVNIVPGRQDPTEGDPVSVVEMKPAPPSPYIDQVKAYSVMLSAETGMPPEYFGFVTENPPSADSIRQREYRLVKRSHRRIGSFGVGWKEVALLALLARDGGADAEFIKSLRARFGDPATPTRAATADEVQKMIASEAWVPNSSVVTSRLQMTEEEIEQNEAARTAWEAKKAREALRQQEQSAALQIKTAKAMPSQQQEPSSTKRPARDSRGSTQ